MAGLDGTVTKQASCEQGAESASCGVAILKVVSLPTSNKLNEQRRHDILDFIKCTDEAYNKRNRHISHYSQQSIPDAQKMLPEDVGLQKASSMKRASTGANDDGHEPFSNSNFEASVDNAIQHEESAAISAQAIVLERVSVGISAGAEEGKVQGHSAKAEKLTLDTQAKVTVEVEAPGHTNGPKEHNSCRQHQRRRNRCRRPSNNSSERWRGRPQYNNFGDDCYYRQSSWAMGPAPCDCPPEGSYMSHNQFMTPNGLSTSYTLCIPRYDNGGLYMEYILWPSYYYRC